MLGSGLQNAGIVLVSILKQYTFSFVYKSFSFSVLFRITNDILCKIICMLIFNLSIKNLYS